MRRQYVDFLDRFDGGGAGRTGNSFQGGGLLSALANIFATPYGSEDRARRAQRRQALGLLDTAAAPPQATVRPGAPFAPRTAPPAGDITTSVLPPVVPSHLTGPKMGMPPPQIPSHLIGPKMGMPPTPPRPVQQPHQFTTHPPQTGEAALLLANEYPQFAAWVNGFSQEHPGHTLNQYAELFLSLQGRQ